MGKAKTSLTDKIYCFWDTIRFFAGFAGFSKCKFDQSDVGRRKVFGILGSGYGGIRTSGYAHGLHKIEMRIRETFTLVEQNNSECFGVVA